MKIEKKHLPDLANILNNYFKTYNTGFNKLDHQNKEEIIWFTCKVMQAVKKTWKPLIPHWTISLAYYFAVCASDEASGLCLFQYYKPTLGNKKPDDMVEEDEGKGQCTRWHQWRSVIKNWWWQPIKRRKLGKKSFLTWKMHKKIGVRGSRCLGTKSYNKTFSPQFHQGPLQHVDIEENTRQNAFRQLIWLTIHTSSLQQNFSNEMRIVVTNSQF